MKKTIITAVLAWGLSVSATATSLTDAVLSVNNYTGSESYTGTFSTASSSRALSTLTLVFDWEELDKAITSTTATSAAVLSTDTSGGANSGLGFMRDDDNNLLVTTIYNGAQHTYTNTSTGETLTYTLTVTDDCIQDGKLAITLMTMGGGSGSHLYMYDGTDSLLHVQDAPLRGSGQWTTLTVNSALTSALDSLFVFNNTVTTTDLVSISRDAMTVPEPATATLSLLALAGLAARRRRK